jgi:hypothetical protein
MGRVMYQRRLYQFFLTFILHFMKNNVTPNTLASSISRQSRLTLKGILALFLCAFVFASCDRIDEEVDNIVDDVEKNEMKMFEAHLTPLNNSGVTGKATIKYSMNGKFEVLIHAKGLAANRHHPQHIHGFAPDSDMAHKDATCPPMSAAGDDGLLTLEESEAFTGPILIPLDKEIVPLTAELNDFPFVRYDGELTYYEMTATKELMQAFDNMYEGKQTEADLKLTNRVIELHGAFVKDGMVMQRYTDGAEYMPTLPVACGEIMKK